MYRILIVEDDAVIARTVRSRLEGWGMEAVCAERFEDVLRTFLSVDPHLVLLDISLPFRNGFYWCSRIREVSQVPIVFLSSAADNMNIIRAMECGGDDFIAKPFDLEVLMAKLQAILRRTYDFSGQLPVLEHRGAVLNLSDATVAYREKKVSLTKNEFRILQTLLEQKGRVVSRDHLMQRLWETDSYVDENTLTVNVTRLRQKLKGIGLEDFILTRKGMGYLIDAADIRDGGLA